MNSNTISADYKTGTSMDGTPLQQLFADYVQKYLIQMPAYTGGEKGTLKIADVCCGHGNFGYAMAEALKDSFNVSVSST